MKKNLTKGMAMGMVMTILAGTTAFANETMLISANPTADKTIESVIAEAEASMYLTQNGTVAGVEASETEGVSIVTIDNEMGGLRFDIGMAATEYALNRRTPRANPCGIRQFTATVGTNHKWVPLSI